MRESLNASSLFSYLGMLRKTDSRLFFVVEGESDVQALQRQVDTSSCKVISGYGKTAVIGALRRAQYEDANGCVGLVDRDFDDLMIEPIPDNVFMTELYDRDADYLLVCGLIRDYIDANRKSRAEERLLLVSKESSVSEIVIRVASLVGRLRLYSLQHALGLKLADLPFGGILIWPSVLDEEKLIKVLMKTTVMDESQLRSVVRCCTMAVSSDYGSCRGHDLIRILAVSSRWWASRNVGQREIKAFLSGAIRCDLLMSLRWFDELGQWAERRGRHIWNCVA